jgi:hypothetical protein
MRKSLRAPQNKRHATRLAKKREGVTGHWLATHQSASMDADPSPERTTKVAGNERALAVRHP